MDNALFPPKWKDAVYNKGDLLPIYIHRKGTWEDSCYFNEKLSSKDDNNDKKMENNKVNEENKENIPDSKPSRVLTNNEAV